VRRERQNGRKVEDTFLRWGTRKSQSSRASNGTLKGSRGSGVELERQGFFHRSLSLVEVIAQLESMAGNIPKGT